MWHWIVVGLVALVFFGGRGKISDMMGDVAKGIKAFKKGMSDDDAATASTNAPAAAGSTQPAGAESVRTIEHQPAAGGATTAATSERRV